MLLWLLVGRVKFVQLFTNLLQFDWLTILANQRTIITTIRSCSRIKPFDWSLYIARGRVDVQGDEGDAGEGASI